MGNCYAIVQQQDKEDAMQMLRRIGIQRRMIGQRLGEAVIQARNPQNRNRAGVLLKRVKTLQSQHTALDSVESQLETIKDINSTHTVLSSVSGLFSVDAALPDLDEIGDIQDALSESQERCAEVDQALRDGFSSTQVPEGNLTSAEIQSELDVILGLADGPSPPPAAGSTLLERAETTVVKTRETTTTRKVAAPKRGEETETEREMAPARRLVIPPPPHRASPPTPRPRVLKETSSTADSTFPLPSPASGTQPEKQQQPTAPKQRLVLS